MIDRHYKNWLARHGTPDRAIWAARLGAVSAPPGITVIMPVCDPRPDWLLAAIASVRAQWVANWELLAVDDASQAPAIGRILAEAAASDPRIKTLSLPARAGISAASNAGLAVASMPYVTFLDHDDRLAPHALAAMAITMAENPDIALAFSDEDQLIDGARARPYFKPGWNPDLLLSQNLVCHLAVYRRDVVTGLGGLRPAFDGSQDFDLALRAVASVGPTRVRHVPEVLYHWRQSPGSFSTRAAPACRDATRRALRQALGPAQDVRPDPDLPQWPDVRFRLPDPAPFVSVIGAAVPPGCYQDGAIEQVGDPALATGEVLVFLAPSLVPVGADWLRTLVAHAGRPEIGAAGARLDGPDGRLLHAGFMLDPECIAHSSQGHADKVDPGYRGQFRLARTVSAVSGDCLAVRRRVFVELGGFRAEAGEFAAVDFCLRLAGSGLRCVWAPQARLRYRVAPSEPSLGAAWMLAQWGDVLGRDPFQNPHLSLRAGRVDVVV